MSLVEEASRTSDRQRRMALYRRADRLVVEEAVVAIPMGHNVRTFVALLRPRVRGFKAGMTMNVSYKHLRLEPNVV